MQGPTCCGIYCRDSLRVVLGRHWPGVAALCIGRNRRSNSIRMTPEKYKIRPNMPTIGRVASAVFGLFLIVGSATVFLAVRPLNWQLVWVGIGSAGLGAHLLNWANRVRLPITGQAWSYHARVK